VSKPSAMEMQHLNPQGPCYWNMLEGSFTRDFDRVEKLICQDSLFIGYMGDM